MPFPQEVEHLVFRGFLTAKIKLSGVNIVLKTVNANEHDLIQHLVSNERDKSFYVLAFSVFLFEKENVLVNHRLEKIELLVEFFKKLRTNLLVKLFKAVIALNKKASESLVDVQRFVLDKLSKMRWHSVKHIGLNSAQYTGIDGTENLGLNMHQQIWYALNNAEEIHEYSEIAWDMLKVVLRTQMKKQDFNRFNARDKKRKEDLERKKKQIFEGRGPDLTDRGTREGLVHELKKSIAGEKDEHDDFIANYEKQMKERALIKDLVLDQLRESRRSNDLADITSDQRAATEEEVTELVSPKRPKHLPQKVVAPSGREKFAQQMAQLSPEEQERLLEQVKAKQIELGLQDIENKETKETNDLDNFFVASDTRLSEEEINNKLLEVKPGTPEYKELEKELRKKSAWKL